LADVNNFWRATSGRNLTETTSFVHLTLILLLHYLWLFTTMNSSAQKIIVRPQNHWTNDRLYVPTATKKRDINATRLLKTRSNFSKSVMV